MGTENTTSATVLSVLCVILLCSLIITACDAEDDFVCPTAGIDARLVGEWMDLENEEDLPELGLKIAADGSCYALGVDWATGLVGVAEEYCFFPRTLPCVGKNMILWTNPWDGPDTLRYEVTENTLKLFNQRDGTLKASYVRLTKGQQIRQPVVSTISWTCDSTNSALGLHSVVQLPFWYTYPCSALTFPDNASITIMGHTTGRHRFTCFIRDFKGTGTYTLGHPYEHKSLAGIGGLCSDVAMDMSTKDDNLSTVTITSYDSTRLRISGSFDLLLADSGGLYVHIVGSFDSPIDLP
jgi:hypothetical protein